MLLRNKHNFYKLKTFKNSRILDMPGYVADDGVRLEKFQYAIKAALMTNKA